MPVDIGLENQAEPRGKSTYGKKLTPNPTLSDSEQRLLSLFDQLPKYEQHRLIEELKANKRGEPWSHFFSLKVVHKSEAGYLKERQSIDRFNICKLQL